MVDKSLLFVSLILGLAAISDAQIGMWYEVYLEKRPNSLSKIVTLSGVHCTYVFCLFEVVAISLLG